MGTLSDEERRDKRAASTRPVRDELRQTIGRMELRRTGDPALLRELRSVIDMICTRYINKGPIIRAVEGTIARPERAVHASPGVALAPARRTWLDRLLRR